MTRVLVISDSHGNLGDLIEIYEKSKADIIIFSGDCDLDLEYFIHIYKNINYIAVKGNCDFLPNNKEMELMIEGLKIIVTHGDLYGVKNNLMKLQELGIKEAADIVIYGHTHIEALDEIKGIQYFNPGALKDGKYGLIILENGSLPIFQHLKI